uniref:GST C-terminal domain-containing protein n=1 Tax=Macrostomum lignano TaxID=282301 RepID=A0A1I8FDG2_9PLAT
MRWRDRSVWARKSFPAFYRLFGVKRPMKRRRHSSSWVTSSESMQSTLGATQNFFAGSESVQMADLMIWPWFERLKPSCSLCWLPGAEERLKSLMSWMGRMEQQRAVLETRNTDGGLMWSSRGPCWPNQPEIRWLLRAEIFS